MKLSITPHIQIMRLDRPIGTFLLLWPTLWALWLAGDGYPNPTIVIIFVLGTLVMRAAGCVINDYADRDLDGHVARTENRPLASGTLNTKQVIGLFSILITIALVLVLQLNTLTIKLSLLALFLAILYPFTKRFTQLPQCFLGLAFSMSIPMVYAALNGKIPMEAWLLFTANFLWIVAYDTQYAMVDREDDLLISVKSTAILLGRFDNLAVGILHGCSLSILATIGWMRCLSWHFYCGIAIAVLFAIYQQYLCKDHDRDKCFSAFLNNNWIGAFVFSGIVLGLIKNANQF